MRPLSPQATSTTARCHDSFAPRMGNTLKPDDRERSWSPRTRLAGTGPTRRPVRGGLRFPRSQRWSRGGDTRPTAPPERHRARHHGSERRSRPGAPTGAGPLARTAAGRGVPGACSGPQKRQTARHASAFCGPETLEPLWGSGKRTELAHGSRLAVGRWGPPVNAPCARACPSSKARGHAPLKTGAFYCL